jgi:hypothetical protein
MNHRICSLAVLSVATACAAPSGQLNGAALGDVFQVHAGESMTVRDTALRVKFAAVVTDSRCGKGEACIVAGDAVIRVSMQRGDSPSSALELHTDRRRSAAGFDGYGIELLRLEPVRISGHAIDASAYVVTLRIWRGEVDADGMR